MKDKVKIHMYVNTGFAGAKHKDFILIDRDEWEEMSEEERDDYLDDTAREYMDNCIDFGAYVED